MSEIKFNSDVEAVAQFQQKYQALKAEIAKVIVGQEKIAEQKVYVFKGSKSNLKYSHIIRVNV